MIVWVKKEAADMLCDQRAEVVTIRDEKVYVILCGTEKPALVLVTDIIGVEIAGDSGERLTIKFNTRKAA